MRGVANAEIEELRGGVPLRMAPLALGGTDEGPPGPRFDNFYAAYFRDLDGNKLNAFFMG